MKIKLFSLAKDLNVGVTTLINFLKTKDLEVANNPNVRIGEKEFKLLMGEYGSQLSKEDKERIIKKVSAPETASKPKTPPAAEKEAKSKILPTASPEKEEATGTAAEAIIPGIVIRGHISIDDKKKGTPSFAKKKEEVKSSTKTTEAKRAAPHSNSTSSQTFLSAKTAKVETTPEKKVEPVTDEAKAQPPIPEGRKEESTEEKPEAITKEIDKVKEPPSSPIEKGAEPHSSASNPKERPTGNNLTEKKEEKSPSEKLVVAEIPTNEKPSVAKETSQTDVSKPRISKPKAEKAPLKVETPKGEEKAEEKTPSAEEKKEPEIFRFERPGQAPKITVVDKIDLSTINDPSRRKKGAKEAPGTKGKRKRINTNAVDIKAEAAKGVNPATTATGRKGRDGKDERRPAAGPQGDRQGRGRRANPTDPIVKPEVSTEDIQRQVKEVRARLAAGKRQSFGKSENRRHKRDNARRVAERDAESRNAENKIIKITEFVTVSDLANLMNVPVNEVIATCMSIDMMVSINMRLEAETIKLISEEFGFETEFVSADVVEAIKADEIEDRAENLSSRPPVVTVMGHVDHGKTSLLDHIRNANVIAGEAGGITQHIGTYSVQLKNGRVITFLDTPGHQAFTAMRARGAKATDVVIIIIDATSDVMPQTVEALNHAAAAGVPIVFAINKIDKSTARPEHIKEKLAQLNYLVEDWGGKYQSQEISAKAGTGVRELLDKVLLEADLLELTANPTRNAAGAIIESSLDKGRGYVSQILVSNGTLRVGDMLLAGKYYGRIKALTNEFGHSISEAGPSTPATILGLDGAPSAGDTFNVLSNEQEARDIARRRRQLDREQDIRTQHRLTLEEIGKRIQIGNFKELNLIIKGDVDGSIEALSDSLIKLSTDEIAVRVIHKAVGQISENDVDLAKASEAVIIGFQVRPSVSARKMAEQRGVEIRTYSVIYDTIDDVRSAMEGMLSPEIKEQIGATLEVLQAFHIKGVGTIAGCMVKEGKIKRTDKVRIIRDGIVIHTGVLGSLKRFKDDAKEVATGLECGLDVTNYNDIQQGDLIESFTEIEVKKKL